MPTTVDSTLLGRLVSLASRELGSALSLRPGWPRRAQRDDLAQASRGHGAFLHLESICEPSLRSYLWLDASLAVEIADRALGGGGVGAPAGHPAASLGEAELGVLAYVAARALREADLGVRVVDLTTRAPGLAEDTLLWPLEARLGEAAGAVRLWLAQSAAAVEARAGIRLRWVIAAEPLERGPLEPGDVVVLEHVARGSEGFLRVVDLDGLLPVRQRGGTLEVGSQSPPDPTWASLEVDLSTWPLAQLANLGAGARVDLTPAHDTILLRRNGQDLLHGELVRLGGKFGLRVT